MILKLTTGIMIALTILFAGVSQRSDTSTTDRPIPSSTMINDDCRLSLTDCGYADNGHNSDH